VNIRLRFLLLVGVSVLVFVGVAVVISLSTPPMYRSSVLVLLNDVPRQGSIDSSDPMVAAAAQDTTFGVSTQVLMFQSDAVVSQALETIRNAPGRMVEVSKVPPQYLDEHQVDVSGPREIRVEQVGDTSVVRVSVDAGSEDLAQMLASGLPESYRGYLFRMRQDADRRRVNFVAYTIDEARRSVQLATADLLKFENQNNVVATPNEYATRLTGGGRPVVKQASRQPGGADRLNGVTRRRQELEALVSEHENRVARLGEVADRLLLRRVAADDPVWTINAATHPVQVAPNWERNVGVGVVLGLLLGCSLALVQGRARPAVRGGRAVRMEPS